MRSFPRISATSIRLISAAVYTALIPLILVGQPRLTFGSIQSLMPAARIDVGGPVQLEKAIRKKLAEIGDDPYTLSELADVLYEQGHVAEARKLWDQAAANEPNLPVAEVEVVYRLVSQGDIEAAYVTLRRARSSNPKDPHVYMAAGELAMRKGKPETASKAYKMAQSLAPKLLVTNLALGRYHEFTNDQAEAKKLYRYATKLAPKRPDGWLLLAANDFKQGDTQQAYQWLQEAEKIDKFQPLAEARLAEMYLGSRDYVGAYRWYRKALARKPVDDAVQVRLGQMQLVLKMRDQARQQFQAVLKRSEFLPALVALGQLEETDDNLKASERLYRRVLALDPDNIIANNNLAMLLVQMATVPTNEDPTKGEQRGGMQAEALRLARNAKRLQPGNPTIMNTYGCALFAAGDPQAAVEVLAKAIRSEPSDSWTRYLFGKALLATGQKEKALEQLESCLILDPDFPGKEEITTLLRK